MTALAIIAAAFSGLAWVFLAINRAVFRPLPGADEGQEWPRVTIVIPARNEERDLEAALCSHRASDYPDFEMIVVDDRSVDATGAIIARIAAEDPRIRAIEGEEPPEGWLGKPHTLWEGAQAASGEWLLFADADVRYAPDVLRRAMAYAQRKRLALLCLLPRIETRGFWEGVIMSNLYAVMYLGPGFLTQIDRVRDLAAGSGAGNLVDRRKYEESGGHAALRQAVIDDIGLALQMKRAGFRTRATTAFDGIRVRMYRGLAEMVEGFSKNVAFIGSSFTALLIPLVSLLLAWLPYVVLAAPSARAAKMLAAAAIGAILAGRAVVSALVRAPIWTGIFHPVMTTVWAVIAFRSWRRRVYRREVIWRGRRSPAPGGGSSRSAR